jgi:hypothetical protein
MFDVKKIATQFASYNVGAMSMYAAGLDERTADTMVAKNNRAQQETYGSGKQHYVFFTERRYEA